MENEESKTKNEELEARNQRPRPEGRATRINRDCYLLFIRKQETYMSRSPA